MLEVADGDTARSITALLATERVNGWSEETAVTRDMWRGITAEPFALDAYSEHYAPVKQVGFMVRDFGTFKIGYSPDGLVGDEGLVEVKSPRGKGHFLTILADEVPAQHAAQLQTGLMVSGRPWIDFVSFHGGMPLFVKRVFPDPAWQDGILAAAVHFEAQVSELVERYQKATIGLHMTERLPDFDLEPVV